jgi:ComEC/Rec2-related protein
MILTSPLLPFALALIFGILWEAMGNLPWLPLIFCSITATIFFTRSYQITLVIAVTISFFIAGALRYEQQKQRFDQFTLLACNKTWTLRGVIVDLEPSYRKPGTTTIVITIEELKNHEILIGKNLDLKLKITTRQNVSNLLAGDRIQLEKVYLHPSKNESYKRYLIKEWLIGHIITKQPIKLLERPRISLQNWFIQQRNRITEKLRGILSPQTFSLFASIFWGKKELNADYMDPIKEQFKTWGIMHYLARSGLHVILFVILWNWLLSFIPISFNLKQILLIFITFFYHIISWPSISFMRSLILFLLYKTCLLLNLQINALHLLSLTTIFVLLINPFQLFFLDFQLSFGLTFALCWLMHLQRKNHTY